MLDIIVGVNGQATSSACAVISATHDLVPGTKVNLQVRQATISDTGIITNGSSTNETIKLGEPPADAPSSPCPGVSGSPKGFIGIGLENDVAYNFPFKISISTPNIGGPSAGLAMTLGIIDELSNGSLLHAKKIAATGTMDPTGTVGDVGGVRQKSIAVSDAGAAMFLVPTVERSTAQATAAATLKIVPVATLNQALNILMAQGGSITMANGTVERQARALSGS